MKRAWTGKMANEKKTVKLVQYQVKLTMQINIRFDAIVIFADSGLSKLLFMF